MEILSSLEKRIKEAKEFYYGSFICCGFLTGIGVFSTVLVTMENISRLNWLPVILFGIMLALCLVWLYFSRRELKIAKKRLALWQDIDKGKYKYNAGIQRKVSELQKNEEDRNRYRWNMNAFNSKMQKLQKEIEENLLQK